jgi:poly(A) polymerase
VIPTRNITPEQIDPDALKVVRRLRRYGYAAYLVGGCVRDLLLKRTPKDFDLATSAHPNEVKKLFRNCRLIGRRFRLAHIHFHQKIIETATFRAATTQNGDPGTPEAGDLLIRSDNVFGTEEEDARRRDFTINALFYDPLDRLLIDHVGGLEDLVSRTVRFIGDPEVRTREDPIRILRAVKFAARLGFGIDQGAWQAMVRYRHDLAKSAPPRILEEIHRILRSGGAETALHLLWEGKILQVLLPELSTYLSRAPERDEERDPGAGLWATLRAVDGWRGAPLSDPVLLSAMLVHPVMDAVDNGPGAYGLKVVVPAPAEVAHQLVRALVPRLRLPKWEAERIQQVIACQKRLLRLRPKEPLPRALMQRAYLPEALELLALGVQGTEQGEALLARLRRSGGGDLPESATEPGEPRPRRRRRRRRGRSGTGPAAAPRREA